MTAAYELHHGDMLEVMPTLQKGSVAMVFADLPYGVTRNRWDVQVPLGRLWQILGSNTRASAALIFTAVQPFAAALLLSNSNDFRYELIYEKTTATGFLNAKKQPLRAHENILVFADKPTLYNPQRVLHQGARKSFANKPNNTQNYGQFEGNRWSCDGTRLPRSVVRLASRDSYRGATRTIHPTQKPIALLEWLIATYTNPGDTVLDPCFGSNTTGVACARLGRRYIGIEKDAEYFRLGKERLEREHEALRTGPAQARLSI